MKIFFTLFLIAIVFTSCSSKKRVVAQAKVFPSWYDNPLTSNASTLYAIGEGDTKTMAINGALSEILASLSVSISSEFSSRKDVTKGSMSSYSVTSSKSVTSKVQAMKITNYEVINENDFGFEKYLIQVKIQKQKLLLGLQQDLDAKFKNIENKTKQSNALAQLRVYKEDKKSVEDMQHTLSIIRALDASFDDSMYLQKVSFVENQYSALLSKITFSIHANRDSSNLKASLAKGLSDEKFTVARTTGENHFKIDVQSSSTRANAYGFNLARSAIIIKVKDFNGLVIASNKINLTGQSTQGYAIAKENVAIKLSAKIEKEGIAKVLGLDI